MQSGESSRSLTHTLRIAAFSWLGYIAALALLDLFSGPRPLINPLHYLVNILNAVAVLVLVSWPRVRVQLGDAFVPLIVVSMSVVPILTYQLIRPSPTPQPGTSPEAMALRLLPVLLIALVLVAWQYRWPQVVFFCLLIGVFSLALIVLRSGPASMNFQVGINLVVIQTASLLAVGYFTSQLMTRLRTQQQSLETANAQLARHASTLEELTISRERNRMARELHDTLAHTLSSLSVQLDTARAYWAVDSPAAEQMLEQALAATRSGLQETRRALKALRAAPLDDLGLVLAVRDLAESGAGRGNLKLRLDLPDPNTSWTSDVEQCAYRVAQEAIANVVHHANAETLSVELVDEQGHLLLVVEDDGRGLGSSDVEKTGHFGLAGMRERADLVGGGLQVDSAPDRGTTVRLTI